MILQVKVYPTGNTPVTEIVAIEVASPLSRYLFSNYSPFSISVKNGNICAGEQKSMNFRILAKNYL